MIGESIPSKGKIDSFIKDKTSIDELTQFIIEIDPDYPPLDPYEIQSYIDDFIAKSMTMRVAIQKSKDPLSSTSNVSRMDALDKRCFNIELNDNGIGRFTWNTKPDNVRDIAQNEYGWNQIDLSDINTDKDPPIQIYPPDGNALGYESVIGFYFSAGHLISIVFSFPVNSKQLSRDAYLVCNDELCHIFGMEFPQPGEHVDKNNFYGEWHKKNTVAVLGFYQGMLSLQFHDKSRYRHLKLS